MLDKLENQLVIRFFAEVFGMTALAAILVLIAGYYFSWSRKTDYSDGFFFVCVALAAIGASREIIMRPTFSKKEDEPAKEPRANDDLSWFPRLLARRSLNFRLLCAAVLCLLISMIVAQ